ncbi:MAG TPA: YceI family protein [Brevundimonas sp.]|jgi:polyisoprenoid-binding protein YceI|uniref:YceI family protein n=1 Tax=Brevundimonas sp. TaxID=1871086 RepID=UPI002ED7CD09
MVKVQHLLALSAVVLLAACGPAAAPAASGREQAASAGPLDLKAPAGVYAVDPAHASLQWFVGHNRGISNYVARFNTFDGAITLDPTNLANSRVEFTIDPASVDAHYPGDYRRTHARSDFANWNEDMARNERFLNAGAFPEIRFSSTSVKLTGPRTADVTGDLSFLGQTRPVTLRATFNGELERHPFAGAPAIGFAAEGRFKRSDFGMALGPVSDEVTVRFDGEFIRRDPAAAAGR